MRFDVRIYTDQSGVFGFLQSYAARLEYIKENDFIFGICADVHHEEGKDETWRMKAFVTGALERRAEFIIQLGDFVNANDAGRRMLEVYNCFPGSKYHVLSNHDTEHGGIEKGAIRSF